MTVVALASTRSSPGVTSLAVGVGLVWQQRGHEPLLVEADSAGGVLGLRFNLAAEPSLATLVADLRMGYESQRFVKNAVGLHGVRALLSPVDPLTAERVLQRNADQIASAIANYGRPTVIDLGRLDHRSPALALAQSADRVLLVSRPRLEDVQSLLYGVRLLRSVGVAAGLVAVGDAPFAAQEVAAHCGIPLVAVVADDPDVAVALSGGRFNERRLRRSLLWRSIQALADELVSAPRASRIPAASVAGDAPATVDLSTMPPPIATVRTEAPPPPERPVRQGPKVEEPSGWAATARGGGR